MLLITKFIRTLFLSLENSEHLIENDSE